MLWLKKLRDSLAKKELIEIYKVATVDEYSFLYVNLATRNANEMFFTNLTGRIELEDVINDLYFYLTITISII